jgi:hypothetical protein
MTPAQIAELLASHDKLRAAIIIAGKEIRKLLFGKKDSPVLRQLRTVVRRSRVVGRDVTE